MTKNGDAHYECWCELKGAQAKKITTSTMLLTAALFLALVPNALARNRWYVDGVNGSDGNYCTSRKQPCKTIGHAISLASSDDSIRVAAATYQENLTIGFSLKIVGSSALTTIIDGGYINTVVTIPNASVDVTLSRVTIRDGVVPVDTAGASGGGIYNNGGNLKINDCTVVRNVAHSGDSVGGGIYNDGGNLTINDSVITSNGALGGGGIFNLGKATITNSTISHNVAIFGGGGILNAEPSMTTTSTLSESSPIWQGYVSKATTTLINKIVERKNRAGFLPEVVANGERLTINNSTFSGNGGGGGGGIWNRSTMTINNSTFSGNSVLDLGGGISNPGTATISNSTFNGNFEITSTGGAIQSGPMLMITNCTFSGNEAVMFGGAISATGGVISNSTFSANRANGFIRAAVGGGAIDGPVTIQNSIVANSTGSNPGNCSQGLLGPVMSNGYNISDDSTCGFNSIGDMNNIDPQLGPLHNNGGPTQTMAIPSGSPAVNAGNPGGCTDGNGHLLKTDQRGMPRPDEESGRCDIGAYELQSDD